MKSIVIFDSQFGNTEKIARTIAEALGPPEDVITFRVNDIDPAKLREVNLIVVGSPTQGFRPTKAVKRFLDNIPPDSLKGIKVAAFDTRMGGKEAGAGIRLLVKMGGFAAKHIAGDLQKKGGSLAAPPDGFFVKDREGPLVDGELERAAEWAKGLAKSS